MNNITVSSHFASVVQKQTDSNRFENSSKIDDIQKREVKKITHFPLDALKQEFAQYLDEKDWLIDVPFSLLKFNHEQVNTIRHLLKIPITSTFDYKGRSYTFSFMLKTLYQFLSVNTSKEAAGQLTGGLLWNLAGADWLLECIEKIASKKLDQEAIKAWLEMDLVKRDGDWRYIDSGIQVPEKLVESFITYLIETQQNITEADPDFKELSNILRQRGILFEEFHPLFAIEGVGKSQQPANHAFFISFQNENQLINEMTIAKVLNTKSLITTQDFWLDISCLIDEKNENQDVELVPTGENQRGWQAVVDRICKLIHFQSFSARAWAKALFQATCRYRHSNEIPKEVYTNLKIYCNRKKNSFQLAKLLAPYFQKIAEGHDIAKILLSFNTCFFFRTHQKDLGIPAKEFQDVWNDVYSSDLHENKQLKRTTVPTKLPKQLESIQQAIKVLPFELVSSIIEIQKFFLLGCQEPDHSSTFLTEWAGTPIIMASVEELSPSYCLLLPFQPLEALNILEFYCIDFEKYNSIKSLEAMLQLLNDFQMLHPFSFNPHSPIKCYLKELKLDLSVIRDKATMLLNSCYAPLRRLGYLFFFHLYLLKPEPKLLRFLITSLPEGLISFPEHRNDLFNWIERELAQTLSVDETICKGLIKQLKKAHNRPNTQQDCYFIWIQAILQVDYHETLASIAYEAYQIYQTIPLPARNAESFALGQKFIQYVVSHNPKLASKILKILQNERLIEFTIRQEESLFNEICQVVRKKSALLDPEQQNLLIQLVLNIENQEAYQACLNNLIELLQDLASKNPEIGYVWLLQMAQEVKLLKHYPSLPLLWLKYCAAYTQKNDVKQAILIAQEAKKRGVWKLDYSYFRYENWIIQFVGKICELNADRMLALELLALIEKDLTDKCDPKEVLNQIKLRKEKEEGAEKKRQKTLLEQKEYLIGVLNKVDRENQPEMIENIRLLVQQLSQDCTHEKIGDQNLLEAGQLLNHPYLENWVSSTDKVILQDLYEAWLIKAYSKFNLKECLLIVEVAEKFIKLVEKEIKLDLVLIFKRLLNEDVSVSDHLKKEIRQRQLIFFNCLKQSQVPEEICSLLLAFSKRKIPIQWTFSFIHDIVFWAIFKLFEAPQIQPHLDFITQSLELVAKQSIFENKSFKQQFDFYIRLLSLLFEQKLIKETNVWIKQYVLLCHEHLEEPVITEKVELFDKWIDQCVEQKEYELAFFLMTIVSKPELQEKFLDLLVKHDQVRDPQISARVVINGYVNNKKTTGKGEDELQKKIEKILKCLTNQLSSNDSLLFRFFEESDCALKFDFQPVVNHILNRPAQSLQIKVWNLFQQRTEFLCSQHESFKLTHLWKDWTDCLSSFFKLIKNKNFWQANSELETHLVKLLNAFVELINHLSTSEVANKKEKSPSKEQLLLEQFMQNCLAHIQPGEYVELIKCMIDSWSKVKKIPNFAKSSTSFELDTTLVKKLIDFNQSDLFIPLCEVFYYLLVHYTKSKYKRVTLKLLFLLTEFLEGSHQIPQRTVVNGLRMLELDKVVSQLENYRTVFPFSELTEQELNKIKRLEKLSQMMSVAERIFGKSLVLVMDSMMNKSITPEARNKALVTIFLRWGKDLLAISMILFILDTFYQSQTGKHIYNPAFFSGVLAAFLLRALYEA